MNNRVHTPQTLAAKSNREGLVHKLSQWRYTVMIPQRLAAIVAVIALLSLGGCQKKETEQKKSEAENAAKERGRRHTPGRAGRTAAEP